MKQHRVDKTKEYKEEILRIKNKKNKYEQMFV